ncbi:hypothetical protein ES703_59521 [subsurface metagenome]
MRGIAVSWNNTSPSVFATKPSIAFAIVVFPHPLSPTNPTVSPNFTSNETPSTALTAPIFLFKIPPKSG